MATLEHVKDRLLDPSSPVAARMRAIFGLKGLDTPEAVSVLEKSILSDPSALVRHEVAYVLGQMRAEQALGTLKQVLQDADEDVMVRHEAAEAMGAIAHPSVLQILDDYADDNSLAREIRETCLLAAERIRWAQGEQNNTVSPDENVIYRSVDPAPPEQKPVSTKQLRDVLCDVNADMFIRYRAMFALRNRGGPDAVDALCESMHKEKESALFRHEVAYVLGQMQSERSVSTLEKFLQDPLEHAMVRHEAAEALGSVGTKEADAILDRFQKDESEVVRESVEVALDISDYVTSDELHYMDNITDQVNKAAIS